MKKMIKIITACMLSLSLCLLIASPVQAANINTSSSKVQSEFDTLYIKVSSGNVNVRKGPGTKYAIVGKLRNGTKIIGWSVFGKTDPDGYGWTSIRAKDINGKEVSGWVRDDYIIRVNE